MAARASNGVVYTPQVVLDGRALRPAYRSGAVNGRLSVINRDRGRATISGAVASTGRGIRVAAEVDVTDSAARQDSQVWVALFEQGLSSRVTRGENAGKLLYHDFVVRDLSGPFPIGTDGRGRVDHVIELLPDWSLPRLGLAIFVQRRDDGSTLQAVSSYPLCGG